MTEYDKDCNEITDAPNGEEGQHTPDPVAGDPAGRDQTEAPKPLTDGERQEALAEITSWDAEVDTQPSEAKARAVADLVVADTRTPEGNYLTRDNIVPSGASPAHIQAAIRGAAEQDDIERSPHANVDEIMLTLSDDDVAEALAPTTEVDEDAE